ncbi:MAG: hypothetical protein IPM57_10780 [Oligoflexia bacterium]|nr:hypothetical protein [Oligoflexia bacterium]
MTKIKKGVKPKVIEPVKVIYTFYDISVSGEQNLNLTITRQHGESLNDAAIRYFRKLYPVDSLVSINFLNLNKNQWEMLI